MYGRREALVLSLEEALFTYAGARDMVLQAAAPWRGHPAQVSSDFGQAVGVLVGTVPATIAI
ncbi:MAG: hypothetical protein HY318_06945 [Armatimonadetes bacterium]|nr:hypothetical protein [Armatimonadota bacterium]